MTILEFFRRAFNINPKEVKIVEVTNNLNEEILRGGIIDTPDETTIEKKVIKEEVIEEVIKEIKVKKLGKLAQRRLRQQK